MRTLLKLLLPVLIPCALVASATAQIASRIAFQSSVTVKTPKPVTANQIFSMNSDGTGVAQLTGSSAASSNPS